jgi:hypothetical protein
LSHPLQVSDAPPGLASAEFDLISTLTNSATIFERSPKTGPIVHLSRKPESRTSQDMKKITNSPTLVKFALSVLYAATVMNIHAQTWQTILDLGPSMNGYDVLVNPFTNSPPGVFVAVDISGPDNEIAFFDTSRPQSASNPSVVVPLPGLINRLGCDTALGALYSVGYVRKADNSLAWDVRTSLDDGQSWGPLDSGWQLSLGVNTRARGFASDQAGNLFVCGNAIDSKGRVSMILRKSGDRGMTWQTQAIGVDAVALHFLPANSLNQGGLFAVGRPGVNAWGVQRSRDAGNTWTTVDSWTVAKSGDTAATAIASDPQGNLYVAGHGRKGINSPYGWYVRRSSDGGNTWQMLLTNFSAGGDSLVNDAVLDAAGNLWVVGAVNGANSITEIWAMQRWNQVSGWSGPMYPYGNPSPRSHARGTSADPTGRVYVTGWVFDPNDPSDYSHATVLEVNN